MPDNDGVRRPADSASLSEEDVLSHIARLPHGRASFKTLVRELGIKGRARADLDDLLTRLTDRGELIGLRGDQYVVTSMSREFTTGVLRMHRDGYGFVVPDKPVPNMQGDLFIPPDKA